jgi:hypothetical protein
MSHQAVNWAIEQRAGGPSPKATLWSIANYANEDWCSWPSQKTIGDESEQSTDTVQRQVSRLEEAGLIRRIPLRYAGRRSSNFYILRPSPYFDKPVAEIEPILPRGYSVLVPSESVDVPESDAKNDTADCGIVKADDTATDTANDPANDPATVRQQEKNLGTLEGRSSGGGARESGGLSPEAHRLSADIAKLCGHDIEFLPPRWARDGARVAQAWIEAGYSTEMMFGEVKLIMARKADGKPESITYFDKPFAREHALHAKPHQLPKVTINPREQEVQTHERSGSAPTADWKTSRDNWRSAAAEFGAAVDALDGPAGAGGQGG